MVPRAQIKDEKAVQEFPGAFGTVVQASLCGCLWLMALLPTDQPDVTAGPIGNGRDQRAPTAHHRSLTWGSIRACCRQCGHSCEAASVT
jgi:hypothetical protein